MPPGDETPRARRGGAPRAGGRSPRPSGDVCAEPLPLEGSPETRGVPSSGAGPSQNGTCSGGGIGRKIRAGRSTVNDFRFGRTRVKRQSFCTEWKNGFFGDRTSANSRIMVPHRAEHVWGVVHTGRKIRAGKRTLNYFGSGGPESIYASQSSSSEIMGCLGEELQQAVV